VAAHLARDPERVLTRARKNLERFSEIHSGSTVQHWLRRWQNVLAQGPEVVMETLTSSAPEAAELRQNSPFPGVLPETERRDVLESFAKYWTQTKA
jgi:transposase-like protein